MTPSRTTVDVIVTPQIRQGNDVYCEIDPAGGGSARYVKGGIIKLRSGGTYDVNFTIQAFGAKDEAQIKECGDLAWSAEQGECATVQGAATMSNAFWSDRHSCPTSATQDSQVKNVTVNGGTLTVEIVPDGSRNVVHYSLNFADGSSCDPIIINTVTDGG